MLEFLLLVILLLLWNMADFFYTMIFNIGENFTVEKILGLTSEKVDFSSFNAFFNSLGYKFSQSPLSSAFVVLLTIAVFILFSSAIFAVLKGMATTNEETKKKYHPYTVLTTTVKSCLYFVLYTTTIFTSFFVINAFTSEIGKFYRAKQLEIPISSILAESGRISLFGFQNQESPFYFKEDIFKSGESSKQTLKIDLKTNKENHQLYSIEIHKLQKYLFEYSKGKEVFFYYNVEPIYINVSDGKIKTFEKDGQVYPYYELVNELYLVVSNEKEYQNDKIILYDENNNEIVISSELQYLQALHSFLNGKNAFKKKQVFKQTTFYADTSNWKKNANIVNEFFKELFTTNVFNFKGKVDLAILVEKIFDSNKTEIINAQSHLQEIVKQRDYILTLDYKTNKLDLYLLKELMSYSFYSEYLKELNLLVGLNDFRTIKQPFPFEIESATDENTKKEIKNLFEIVDEKEKDTYQGFNTIDGDNYNIASTFLLDYLDNFNEDKFKKLRANSRNFLINSGIYNNNNNNNNNNKFDFTKLIKSITIDKTNENIYALNQKKERATFKDIYKFTITLNTGESGTKEYTYYFDYNYIMKAKNKIYGNQSILKLKNGERVKQLINVQTLNAFKVFGFPNPAVLGLAILPEVSAAGFSFKISSLLQQMPLFIWRGIPIPVIGYLFYFPGEIDLLQYSAIVSYMITIPVVVLLFKILMQVVFRVMSIIGLIFITGPFAIAKSPLDNGEAIKKWTKQITSKAFQLFFIYTSLYVAGTLISTLIFNEDITIGLGDNIPYFLRTGYFLRGILTLFILKGIDLWLKNNDKVLDFDNQAEEQMAEKSAQKLEKGIKTGIKGAAMGAGVGLYKANKFKNDVAKAYKQAKEQGIDRKQALFGKNGQNVFNKGFRDKLNANDMKKKADKQAQAEATKQFERDDFENQVLDSPSSTTDQKDIIKGLRSDDKNERLKSRNLIQKLKNSDNPENKKFLENINKHYSKDQIKGKVAINRDYVDEYNKKKENEIKENTLKNQREEKSRD